MRAVSIGVDAPVTVRDEHVASVIEALLDLWRASWGDPEPGTLLTVLCCARTEYDGARDAPYRDVVLPEVDAGDGGGRRQFVVTDDPGASHDRRAWCELEKGRTAPDDG